MHLINIQIGAYTSKHVEGRIIGKYSSDVQMTFIISLSVPNTSLFSSLVRYQWSEIRLIFNAHLMLFLVIMVTSPSLIDMFEVGYRSVRDIRAELLSFL